MIHRHLDVPPATAPEALPSAALVDILHRGDLDDWRPLAAAIARDPEGAFADRVLRLVDAYPAYGVSPLWRAWIDRCRARAEGSRVPAPAIDLKSLRRESGLTQVELARRAGMSQSDLSKFERRTDVRLSTLRACVEALGGRLRILCEAGGKSFEIRPGATDPSRGSSGTRRSPGRKAPR